jgi:hypothetical protein
VEYEIDDFQLKPQLKNKEKGGKFFLRGFYLRKTLNSFRLLNRGRRATVVYI